MIKEARELAERSCALSRRCWTQCSLASSKSLSAPFTGSAGGKIARCIRAPAQRWQSPGSLCSRRTPGVPSTSCFCFSPEIFRVGEIPGIPSRLSRIGLSRTRLISPEKCRATSSTSRHWKNAEVRRQAAVPACSVDWSPCAYAAHTADRASRVCRKYSAIALHCCGARSCSRASPAHDHAGRDGQRAKTPARTAETIPRDLCGRARERDRAERERRRAKTAREQRWRAAREGNALGAASQGVRAEGFVRGREAAKASSFGGSSGLVVSRAETE